MNEQPEALRLADALDHGVGTIDRDRHKAADELRRLHAECQRLAGEVSNRNRRALDGDIAVTALENTHAHYEGIEAEMRRLHAEVEHLEKANRRLQQLHATAWNRGHTMGMHANKTIAEQALDAVKQDAWGNTQLTEALMAAEAENEALRADAERYRWLRSRLRDDNYSPYYIRVDEDNAPQEISRSWWALGGNMLDADINAAIDAAREKE